MKFLRHNKRGLNEGTFSESDFSVLNYEQLLQVNGAGGGSGGGGGGGGQPSPSSSSSSSSSNSGNLSDRGYPSSTDYNAGNYTNSGSNSKIQTTINYSKASYASVEGVGLVAETIKQGCYTDDNKKLTVSNTGLFSGKNNSSSIDSYKFGGEITLIIDGKEVESKYITSSYGDKIWDGDYDYIGNVTVDTPIPDYGSVEIKSNIDMSVNGASVEFNSNTSKLR